MSVMSRVAAAVLAALFSVLLAGVPASAHAEFVSSDPQPGAVVPGPFEGPISLTFDEPLADGSHAELLGIDGTQITDATIPAEAPEQLVFVLQEPLAAGEYEIQWTTIGQDGEVDRDTFTITVLEPEPTPTSAPTATPEASATPRPTPGPTTSPEPTPSPTPGPDGDPAASTGDVLFPILAAVIVLAVLAGVLLRNRRMRQG